jgi:DNA ligase-1
MKPMLAVKADIDKLKFPVYIQKKLDGIRCIVKDGVVLSRTLKPIRNEYVQSLFSHLEGADGELVVGSATDEKVFQTTSSGVMSKGGKPDVNFYIFDRWDLGHMPYEERKVHLHGSGERVRGVPANVIHSLNELDEANSTFIADGYEGSILRSPHGLYKFGRSTVNEGFLLKMKIFEDAEFKIVGFVEMMHNENEATKDALGNTERSSHKAGKVKSGILGSLVVEYGDDTFEVGTGFSHAQRKEIFENQLDYIGKDAKIQYQKEGMMDFPRFPSFKGIRDVEDFENGYEKGAI